MRILIIHTVYKLRGGEDSVVANEIELIRSGGHEVELLQFTNIGGTLGKLAQLPFNYFSYAKTKKRIRKFKPDVAHIHNLHYAGSASVIYALNKEQVPIVMTLHNYRLLCPSATMFYNGRMFIKSADKKFNWDAVYKGVYQNSRIITFWVSLSMWLHQCMGTWAKPTAYIALGHFTRDIFKDSKLRDISSRIVIKPNFCYPNKNALVGVPERKAFLYLGRLSEEKGVRTVLAAFAENKLQLVIAGNGPLEAEVSRFAGQYDNITYLGTVNKEQVNDLLINARALLFPSLWYETFGMVVIEAFASGTPVIASNLGQLKYTVKDKVNGLRFETGSVADLNAKVSYLDQLGEEEYAVFRQNAWNSYQQNYLPEQNRELLTKIYANAIEGLK